MMTPGLLPGRARPLLTVGVIDGEGGIDIQVQPRTGIRGRPGRPRRRPRVRAGGPDTGQMLRAYPGIDQPPHRGRRGGRAEDMLAIPARLPDTVDAVRPVSDRGHQIGEHRSRGVDPRSPIGVGQRRRDLR